jgi:hypothetical protein
VPCPFLVSNPDHPAHSQPVYWALLAQNDLTNEALIWIPLLPIGFVSYFILSPFIASLFDKDVDFRQRVLIKDHQLSNWSKAAFY